MTSTWALGGRRCRTACRAALTACACAAGSCCSAGTGAAPRPGAWAARRPPAAAAAASASSRTLPTPRVQNLRRVRGLAGGRRAASASSRAPLRPRAQQLRRVLGLQPQAMRRPCPRSSMALAMPRLPALQRLQVRLRQVALRRRRQVTVLRRLSHGWLGRRARRRSLLKRGQRRPLAAVTLSRAILTLRRRGRRLQQDLLRRIGPVCGRANVCALRSGVANPACPGWRA